MMVSGSGISLGGSCWGGAGGGAAVIGGVSVGVGAEDGVGGVPVVVGVGVGGVPVMVGVGVGGVPVMVGVVVTVGVGIVVAVGVGVGSCWVMRRHVSASEGLVLSLVTRTKLHISDTPTGMSSCMTTRNVTVTVDRASIEAQVSRKAVMAGSAVPGVPTGV
jgi:hypothetical protein